MDGLCALGTQTVFLFVAAWRTESMRLSASLFENDLATAGLAAVSPRTGGD